MRGILRFLGLILAAGAFVAFVIDGAHSIADDTVRTEPVGALWGRVAGDSLAAFRSEVDDNLSPIVWDHLVQPILTLPVFAVLLILAVILLTLGRRPRSRIGYALRG
jgi:hypothetical protein